MKTKTRLFISFVIALSLLLFALPRLPVYGSELQFGFSVLWLSFCIIVIGANFHALLRLGRGEVVERQSFSKEEREAINRLQRYKRRRIPSR